MEIPEDTATFSFKSPKTLVGETEIELTGELVFTWPYKWDTEIAKSQPLIDRLTSDTLAFLNKRFDGKHTEDSLMKDVLRMATFTAPPSWRKTAPNSTDIYRKLLLYDIYFFMSFKLDDSCERLSGEPRHEQYVKSIGRLLYKLFLLEFKDIRYFRESQWFIYIAKTYPMIENYLLVLFDIVEEIQTRYELIPLKLKGVANGQRYLYELQTWFQTENHSHLFNPSLRHLLRSYTIGFDMAVELCMALDGCYVSDKVRQNFYWKRQYDSARTIIYLLNDILSAPKEMAEGNRLGKIVDCTVLILMEKEKMSFEEALRKTIQLHNEKVLEFRNEVNSIFADKDLMFDMNEEEKISYFRSLDYLGICLSHFLQTHLLSKRYGLDALRYEFISSTAEGEKKELPQDQLSLRKS